VSAEEGTSVPIARRFPFVAPGYRATHGLLGTDALCLRVLADGFDAPAGEALDAVPTTLWCAGDADERATLARSYVDHVAAWTDAGRPTFEGIRLRVYPFDAGEPEPPADAIIAKRWNRIAIDWLPA
jgi:hypothetical protein